MVRKMFLMLGNSKVLYFNFPDFTVEIIREELLPYSLRCNIQKTHTMKSILSNVQEVKNYLSSRMLSLSRDHAKKIYAAFQIPQVDTIDNRVDICIRCKGVSIQDSYWVQDDDDTDKWEDINIRKNKLKDIIDLSLGGYSPTVTTSPICPELTTKGLFRKGWIRMGDTLYLLKSDKTKDSVNTRMEILASKIMECFENKIDCVEYEGDDKNMLDGMGHVSICKNFVGEEYSFVEAWEVMDYCRRCNISFRERCLERWGAEFACIPVLDYIIVNTDRHTQNYGFMMNNETGNIEHLAPLFDFNCALVADYFQHDARDTLSQMFNSKDTLRELAFEYKDHANLVFNEDKFMNVVEHNEKYKYIFEKVYARIAELGIV
jgi:hypothetical protein